MDVRVTINVAQQSAILHMLSPEARNTAGHAAMQESVAYMQGEVQKGTPVDQGLTRGRIFTELRGVEFDALRGIVASPDAHAVPLENGRRPNGPMPPVAPIEAWASRHGMPGAGWAIARSIAKKGTKAHHMFRDAATRGQRVVDGIFARHIQAMWRP